MDKIIDTLNILEVDYNDGIKALGEILEDKIFHVNIDEKIKNIRAYFHSIMMDQGISEEEIYEALDEYAFNKILYELEEVTIDVFFDGISYNKWKKYISGEYKEILIYSVNNKTKIELSNINTEELDKLTILKKWICLFGNGGNLQLDLISINEKNDVEIQSYIKFIEQSVLTDENKQALINYYQNESGVLLIRGKKIEILFSENKFMVKDQKSLGEYYMEEKLDYVFLANGNKDFIELCINTLNTSNLNTEKNIELFYKYISNEYEYKFIEFIGSNQTYKINSLNHFGVMFKELNNFFKTHANIKINLG